MRILKRLYYVDSGGNAQIQDKMEAAVGPAARFCSGDVNNHEACFCSDMPSKGERDPSSSSEEITSAYRSHALRPIPRNYPRNGFPQHHRLTYPFEAMFWGKREEASAGNVLSIASVRFQLVNNVKLT